MCWLRPTTISVNDIKPEKGLKDHFQLTSGCLFIKRTFEVNRVHGQSSWPKSISKLAEVGISAHDVDIEVC